MPEVLRVRCTGGGGDGARGEGGGEGARNEGGGEGARGVGVAGGTTRGGVSSPRKSYVAAEGGCGKVKGKVDSSKTTWREIMMQ